MDVHSPPLPAARGSLSTPPLVTRSYVTPHIPAAGLVLVHSSRSESAVRKWHTMPTVHLPIFERMEAPSLLQQRASVPNMARYSVFGVWVYTPVWQDDVVSWPRAVGVLSSKYP